MTDTWTWATVTQASPLRIKVDGDTTALDATTDNLVGSLAVDDRVRVHLHADGIIVTGLQGGTSNRHATQENLEGVLATLDQARASTVAVFIAGDSTSDGNAEGIEVALSESLSALWPERPAQLRRWNTGGDAWYGYNTLKSGDRTDANAVLLRDDFDSTFTEVVGEDPAAGLSAYTGNTGLYRTTGGRLLTDVGGSSAYLTGHPIARGTSNFKLTWKLAVSDMDGTNGKAVIPMAQFGAGSARVGIWFYTNTVTPTLKARIRVDGGSDTDLYSFTIGASLAETTISMERSGTSLIFKVGSQTFTHTLTSTEQTDLAGTITPAIFSTPEPGASFDYWELTGSKAYTGTLPSVSIDNGSAAGESSAYQLARVATMVPYAPGLVIINHGHNHGSETAAEFLANIQALVNAIEALHGVVPVAITSQNPEYSPATNRVAQNTRMFAISDYAADHGWAYLPTFEAFAQKPDGGRAYVKLSDGVHPTQDGGVGSATGSRLSADVISAWFTAVSNRTI